MEVRLLYFGVLRELFASERETVQIPQGETVAGLLRHLEKHASKQSAAWNALAVAVNQEYATRHIVLQDGDEVALLPPVSGGFGEVEA